MDQQSQIAWREVLHCAMCQCQVNLIFSGTGILPVVGLQR